MLDVFNYCQVQLIGANFALRKKKMPWKKKDDISLVTLYYFQFYVIIPVSFGRSQQK